MTVTQGTPSWLRDTNDRTALALLLERGELTRNQIGELTGLSKPTASQIVSRLESAGLVHPVGEVSAGRGPNAASYAVRAERVLGVAVNINHLVVESTVVDASGVDHPIVVAALSSAARERNDVADVTEAIRAACHASGMPTSAVQLACIGVQGAVDPRTDQLSFVEGLPGWPRKGVRKGLEDALGHAVYIDNDANLAAIAERACGAGADRSGFALLWIGEGLGIAVDIAGAVHRGVSGGAGEIGYLPIPQEAVHLDPDAKDLQELIGAAAVRRVARAHGVHKRSYQELVSSLASAPQRDAILAELAPRIAVGVIPVLALLDPERVILGGPIGSIGGPRLAELVQASIRHSSRWTPHIEATAVPDHPVLRGARELLLAEVRTALVNQVGVISQ
ncbi:MAG: ROK family transcriptional regulator [Pseudolysinimonas sp.]